MLPSYTLQGFRNVEVCASSKWKLRIPVRPYIPNPMRCFKCQEFGHGAAVCKKNVKCVRCSVEGHEDKGCTAPFKCSHCSAGHSAYCKDCPVWKQEIAIQEYKARNGCTFGQAKAHFMALPKSQYSLTKSCCSQGCKNHSHTDRSVYPATSFSLSLYPEEKDFIKTFI